MKEKRLLREKILTEKKSISHNIIRESSRKIQKQLVNLPQFLNAKTIFTYAAMPWEIETAFVWEYLGIKQLVFPKVAKDKLELFLVKSKDELEPGIMGISEPTGGIQVALNSIDFAIVPGVAFDRLGNRLGYGRGYYDKVLPFINGMKVGVVLERYCFSGENGILPLEKHDIPVDLVITEQGIYGGK